MTACCAHKGMLRLQDLRIEEALGDLRRVVFLDGGDRMARYWYATALLLAGRSDQAHGQAGALGRLLRHAAPDEVLEDGCTTARELHTALRVMGRHRP